MHQNSSWQSLYVEQPNKNIDGDDHFYMHPIDYSGGSFVLKFSLYVLDNQYDAGLKFGISSNPNNAWGTPDISYWTIQYGTSDAGARPHVSGRGIGEAGGYYTVVNPYTDTEGHWWYHEFTFDDSTKTSHTFVSEGKGPGGTVLINHIQSVPNGYSPDMDYLVLSDNRNHMYPSTGFQTYGIGYLDDVSFIPEPATMSLLLLGGSAIARKKRG